MNKIKLCWEGEGSYSFPWGRRLALKEKKCCFPVPFPWMLKIFCGNCFPKKGLPGNSGIVLSRWLPEALKSQALSGWMIFEYFSSKPSFEKESWHPFLLLRWSLVLSMRVRMGFWIFSAKKESNLDLLSTSYMFKYCIKRNINNSNHHWHLLFPHSILKQDIRLHFCRISLSERILNEVSVWVRAPAIWATEHRQIGQHIRAPSIHSVTDTGRSQSKRHWLFRLYP